MATWTPPKNWEVGEALTADDMNTYISDNLEALKEPPTDYYECDESSDYTTTSTSFVDVDATNLSLTITTTGGDVLVGFDGWFSQGTTGMTYLDVDLDGARIGGDDGINRGSSFGNCPHSNIGFVILVTDLDAGSHTFKLQWKVSGGSVTLYAGAGTSGADVHPQFFVREV